jgi:hypothetical protein
MTVFVSIFKLCNCISILTSITKKHSCTYIDRLIGAKKVKSTQILKLEITGGVWRSECQDSFYATVRRL